MLKLYSIPMSLYCAKTRVLLRHKGLEFEEMPPPGGYGSDEYKTYVPSGNLPALLHPQNQAQWKRKCLRLKRTFSNVKIKLMGPDQLKA